MKKGPLIAGCLVCLTSMAIMAMPVKAQAPGSSDKATQVSQILEKADILYVRKLYDDAIVEYRKALKIDPKDSVTHNKLGMAYQQLQKPGAAKKSYEQAIKLNPNYVEALNNLGTAFYALKNYNKAIRQYKKAIAIQPLFATAFRNMGAACFADNKFEEGFKAYTEAYRLDPAILERASTHGAPVKTGGSNQAMQYFYIAKLYASNSDMEKALVYLEKAHENGFADFQRVERDSAFQGLLKNERYIRLLQTKSP